MEIFGNKPNEKRVGFHKYVYLGKIPLLQPLGYIILAALSLATDQHDFQHISRGLANFHFWSRVASNAAAFCFWPRFSEFFVELIRYEM